MFVSAPYSFIYFDGEKKKKLLCLPVKTSFEKINHFSERNKLKQYL